MTDPAAPPPATFSPAIIHVDMDAFFAAVEQRDRPELRGQPVLVGGAHRGVVAAASYEARRFGIRSAMPMVEARRRCPMAHVVAPRSARYMEISEQVFAIFERYTPLVEGLSLDEAFLDVGGSQRLFGPAHQIAADIRSAIREEVGLTASAGVAPCKFVAKIASDLDKPDGLVVVPQNVAEFLSPLPLERMWGVGRRAAAQLHSAGYNTIGDLARGPAAKLTELLGSWGETVHALALGIDPRPVVPDRDAKSISSENTFADDLHRRAELEHELLLHAARVARRLTAQGLRCQGIRVKLKYADFVLRSRQQQLETPLADTASIAEVARALLSQFPRRRVGVRLIGVAAVGLCEEPQQLGLFADPTHQRRERLEHLSLNLEQRFGASAITRAALLPKPSRAERTPEQVRPTPGAPKRQPKS